MTAAAPLGLLVAAVYLSAAIGYQRGRFAAAFPARLRTRRPSAQDCHCRRNIVEPLRSTMAALRVPRVDPNERT
jgi:hypothetical protein